MPAGDLSDSWILIVALPAKNQNKKRRQGKMAKSRKQYQKHGSHYGSGDVSLEAHEAAKRWEEDVEVLRRYGYTESKLEEFRKLVMEHDNLRTARPEVVTVKLTAVKVSRAVVREARVWLDRAYSNMEVLQETEQGIEEGIAGIKAMRKDGLDAEVGACLALVKERKAMMHADTEPDALIAEGEALIPRLKAASPQKSSAKGAAKADTEELDYLDGRLLEIVAGLNSAGRKAFRAAGKRSRAEDYKYQHIAGKPSETAKEKDVKDEVGKEKDAKDEPA